MRDSLRTIGILAIVGLSVWAAGAAAHAEDAVLVNIRGPLAGRVGDRVTYDVELVNRSGRDLQKLRVIDYFDAGFHHEASKSPIEQKGTVDLAAGTSRRVTLEFLLDEPGRQCHRVEILDQAHQVVGGATECVQVAPAPVAAASGTAAPAVAAPIVVPPAATPSLPAASTTVVPSTPLSPPPAPAVSLDLSGPAELMVGGTATYTVKIRNTGNAASSAMLVDISWADGMEPVAGSEGWSLDGSRVAWSVPAIAPGGEQERQLVLQAKSAVGLYRDSPPARTAVRTALTDLAGGVLLADQESVQIRSLAPRPEVQKPVVPRIRLSLADLDDPVRAGDPTTIVCTVTNEGDSASGPLSLVIDLPRGARPVGDGRVRIEDGRLFFDTVEVPPGQRRSFEVSYRLADAGRGTAVATLSGSSLEGRLERECQTDFIR